MADIMEVIMVVCFGISWPLNIRKAWRARTARGSSVLFYFFIWVGYVFGLASKAFRLASGLPTPVYVWFFYGLNLLMVSAGILIYYRNLRLDKLRETAEAEL